MPSTIPFDPSLSLGNIVDPQKIKNLKEIANAQKGVDNAYDLLNSSLLTKHKLDMVFQELLALNINESSSEMQELREQMKSVDAEVTKNAVTLAKASVTSSKAVADIKNNQSQNQIYESVESPIDFEKSDIKMFDLSSDSMNMDVQYVRNEFNMESSAAHASSVASAVSHKVSSFLSPSYAASLAGSVKSATYSQTSNHNIEGTIVITVNCTHRSSRVFSPLVLNVDKAIEVWNAVKTNPKDKLDYADPIKVKMASKEADDSEPIQLLSGQTSGSSFVGLIHITHEENSSSRQSSSAMAASISAEIKKNLFLASASGKFGVDASYSNNLKSLFSSSSLRSHCNIFTMGSIPTIASNVVETTVARLAPNPKQVMEQLAAIQGANDTTVNSMGREARNAQIGKQFMELNNSYVTSVVSELGSYDNNNNKVIDQNSLMAALEDFIAKAREGGGGVPISFFIKPITKQWLAKEYLNKYFPNGIPAATRDDKDIQKGGGGGEDGEEDAGTSA